MHPVADADKAAAMRALAYKLIEAIPTEKVGSIKSRDYFSEASDLLRCANALAPPQRADKIMASIKRQPFNEGKVEQLFQQSQIMAGIKAALG